MPLKLDHDKENVNPQGKGKGKQVVQRSEGKSD